MAFAHRGTLKIHTREDRVLLNLCFTDAGLRFSQDSLPFFDPTTAKRVGDRGDGRGVRYPTYFNQDLLHSVAEEIKPLGLTLSHHTSEPPFTTGYIAR